MLKKFNELNSTTYLSASHKALGHGQPRRSRRLTDYVFHELVRSLNHYTNLQPLCSYTNRYIKKDLISLEQCFF